MGWVCDEAAFLLYSFAKIIRPEVVIQTGHLWGKGVVSILEGLHDGILDNPEVHSIGHATHFIQANRPPKSNPIVVSIDPALDKRSIPGSEAGIAWLREHYPDFHFERKTANDYFKQPNPYPGKRIMGVVDGDHAYLEALADMEHLRDWGAELIVIDDTTWLPHLTRLVHDFQRHNPQYTVLNLTLYNGVAILWDETKRLSKPSPRSHLPKDFGERLYHWGLLGVAR